MKTPKAKPSLASRKMAAGRCCLPYCRGKRHGRNCKCSKCMMREWRAKYPLKAAYSDLRYRARRRGIEFTLTVGQFNEICAKSGYLERKGSTKHALQIDRINPNLGYTWDNCQVITCSENTSKGNHERTNPEDTNEPF